MQHFKAHVIQQRLEFFAFHIQETPQSYSNYLPAWKSLECLILASQSTEPCQLSQSPWL